MDEQALISAAKGGDLEAFNDLVIKYQDQAYNHACCLMGDPDLAADVTQDAFIKAYTAIHTFRDGSLRAWLLRIVTNTAHDEHRRRSRHPNLPLFPQDREEDEIESPLWLYDTAPLPEETSERKSQQSQLMEAIASLTSEYRAVIILIDLQEINYSEAAAVLGLPIGTIKSRLARARMQLRQKLYEKDNVSECSLHPRLALKLH